MKKVVLFFVVAILVTIGCSTDDVNSPTAPNSDKFDSYWCEVRTHLNDSSRPVALARGSIQDVHTNQYAQFQSNDSGVSEWIPWYSDPRVSGIRTIVQPSTAGGALGWEPFDTIIVPKCSPDPADKNRGICRIVVELTSA